MVVHWPNGIKAKGEVRSQFHHVIDVAPTVLEAAGLPEPTMVNGTKQRPMDGVSMLYAVRRRQGQGPPHHAVLRDVRQPRHLPRRLGGGHAPLDSVADRRRSCRRSARTAGSCTTSPRTSARPTTSRRRTPQKLKELQDLFAKEAIRNHVFPLDDRRSERFNAAIAGRPDLIGDRKSLTLYEGMTGIAENAFINIKGRSHTITAEVEVPRGRRQRRHHRSGRPLRRLEPVHEGRPRPRGLQLRRPPADHRLFAAKRWRRAVTPSSTSSSPTAAKPGDGGMSRLSVDGKQVGEAHVPRTMPFVYSADEGVDVGMDNETPVTEEYKERNNKFTGKIHKVTVELK